MHVLNVTDYDLKTYGRLRSASRRIKIREEEGKGVFPAFPSLLADVWCGLFKKEPALVDKESVAGQAEPNHMVMQELFKNPEFVSLREFTMHDEFASAIGALHLTGELLRLFRKEEQNPGEDMGQDENGQSGGQNGETAEDAGKAVLARLTSEEDGEIWAQAVRAAVEKTAEEQADVLALVGDVGGGYGTGPGQMRKAPAKEALALADAISDKPLLKKVADLAGRAKAIAAAKQKSKTREAVERSGVETGNDISRLLPSEILMLRHAKKDFLRRYAEGQLFQYAKEGKERVGQGPVVVCIDTSGSMTDLDPQSKAIMVALLAIARRQRRAFAVVNFADARQCRCWEYPRPQDIGPAELIEMITQFYGGGTDFQTPLTWAAEVIEHDQFKKADVVFITDGNARLSQVWLRDFLAKKKQKEFQVISIALGSSSDKLTTLSGFSDQVIEADELFDEKVLQTALSI